MTTVADLKVKFSADLGNVKSAISDVDNRLNKLESGSRRAGGGLRDMFNISAGNLLSSGIQTATSAVMGLGRVFVGALGNAIQSSAELNAQISTIGALSNSSTADLAKVKELINALGVDPTLKVSTTEAADAIQMLLQNGLTLPEVMDGAARSTVLLANATGANLTTAADVATSTMQAFGISANEMDSAVDGIASVLVASKHDIDDYRLALSQAGGVAALVGVEFDDFNVMLASTAASFSGGSDQGTAFKTFLQRLVPQSNEAEEAMSQLGLYTLNSQKAMQELAQYGIKPVSNDMGKMIQQLMGAFGAQQNLDMSTEKGLKAFNEYARESGIVQNQLFDTNGALKSQAEIAGVLNHAFKDLTELQKISYLTTIFGSDGMKAAGAIMQMTEQDVLNYKKAMANTDAEEMARKQVDNLAGDMTVFGDTVDALQRQLVDGLDPSLRRIFQTITPLIAQATPQLVEMAKNFTAAFVVPAVDGFIAKMQEVVGLVKQTSTFSGGLFAALGSLTGGEVSIDASGMVTEVVWGDWVGVLDWNRYVFELRWSDYVAVLNWETKVASVNWGDWIFSLGWENWIGTFQWGNFVSKVDWWNWIYTLQWRDYGIKIDWANWITRIDWGDTITTITWGTFIPYVTWGDWIASLVWGNFIFSFDWSNWIHSLTWGEFVVAIDWWNFVAVLQWGNHITGINLADYIPAFPGWGAIFGGGSLFGSGFGGFGGSSSGSIGQNANGTNSWRGGWSWVGEKGPELVNLPKGAQVLSNQQSRGMIGQLAGGTGAIGPFTPWDDAAQSMFPSGMGQLPTGPAQGPQTFWNQTASNLFGSQKSQRGGGINAFDAINRAAETFKKTTEKLNEGLTGMAAEFGESIKDFKSALSKVPGLFGASSVTAEQMKMAELGIPQNFADDYLRRLTDEVVNGVDWENVDIKDAAARAGIDPSLPAQAILELFKGAWNDSSLFAGDKNLDLINQDAVREAIARQAASESGQASIYKLFGITPEQATGQAQQLGSTLRTGLTTGLTTGGDNAAAGTALIDGISAEVGKPEYKEKLGASLNGLFTGFLEDKSSLTDVSAAIVGRIAEGFANVEGVDMIGGFASALNAKLALDESVKSLMDIGAKILAYVFDGYKAAAMERDWPGATVWVNNGSGPQSATPPVGKNAGGTSFWRGGLTWVGERGAELVSLPQGARIYNNRDSMAMAGAGGGMNVTIHANVANNIDLQSLAYQVADVVQRRRR